MALQWTSKALGDLARLYTRYAEAQRWTVEVVSESPSELGGYKEVVLRIVGHGAYGKLRFESGLVATITARWQQDSTPDWDLQASSASNVLRAELYPSPTLEHNGDPLLLAPPLRAGGPSLVDDYGYAPQLCIVGERTGEQGSELFGEICPANRGVVRVEFE